MNALHFASEWTAGDERNAPRLRQRIAREIFPSRLSFVTGEERGKQKRSHPPHPLVSIAIKGSASRRHCLLMHIVCKYQGQGRKYSHEISPTSPTTDGVLRGTVKRTFGRAIEPRLDVRVYPLVFETRRTVVDYLKEIVLISSTKFNCS
jgi:hypothetical protein